MMNYKYRVNVVWSDEDDCYLVELPEFSHPLQQYLALLNQGMNQTGIGTSQNLR
jgi:hypothetical protein